MSSKNLRDYSCLSFDCYGTLVDWETGFIEAFKPLTNRLDPSHPLRIDAAVLLQRYTHHETKTQVDFPTLGYSAVLEKAYEQVALECGLGETTTEVDKTAFSATIGTWKSFPDTIDALRRLRQHYKLVILSNVDRTSFSNTLSGPLGPAAPLFDATYVAEEIGSYKPDLRNFTYLIEHCKEELGVDKNHILHTAYSLPADLKPAKQIGLHGCLIERYPNIMGGDLEAMKDQVALDFRFGTLGDMADEVDRVFSSDNAKAEST